MSSSDASFRALVVVVLAVLALLPLAAAYPRPFPHPHPHPRAFPRAFPMAMPSYDPYCPYPQQSGADYDDGAQDYGSNNDGLYGSGDAGYAQGYNAYSSYSGYGAGSMGGYGGGYAHPSGTSASAFGVGYGR